MDLFATSLAARVLAITITGVGLMLLLVGGLYLLAGLLIGRPWLSSRARKLLSIPLWLSMVAYAGFIGGLAGPSLSTRHPGPLWDGLLARGLFFGVEGLCYFALGLLGSLTSRLTTTPPVQTKPMPAIKWAWLGYGPLIGVGLGIGVGLLLGSTMTDAPGSALSAISFPLLNWPLDLSGVFIGSIVGLLLGLMGPFWARIQWRITHLSQAHFLKLGLVLFLLGSGIIGLLFWMIS